MKYFLTGATGLLGHNVLRQLLSRGDDCSTLIRGETPPEVFSDVSPEIIRGDLSSTDVLDRAVANCDCVIHSAGLIHLGWKHLDESLAVNRDGTRAIAEACQRHGKRLVLVGTVNTLALGGQRFAADETTPLKSTAAQVPCSYVLSKRAGVDVVRSMSGDGLSAVIVHPGFMLGPWDWKPSSGRMIVEVAKAWRPIAPSGGCSVCDVRDVADATIAAAHADVPSGREYILAGENWTYKKLWSEIADRVGRRRPFMAAGPLQRWIAAAAGQVQSAVQSRESDFNSAAVRMSSQFHYYDSSRAANELGYQSRSAEASLDDAVQWLTEHGHMTLRSSEPLR